MGVPVGEDGLGFLLADAGQVFQFRLGRPVQGDGLGGFAVCALLCLGALRLTADPAGEQSTPGGGGGGLNAAARRRAGVGRQMTALHSHQYAQQQDAQAQQGFSLQFYEFHHFPLLPWVGSGIIFG